MSRKSNTDYSFQDVESSHNSGHMKDKFDKKGCISEHEFDNRGISNIDQ